MVFDDLRRWESLGETEEGVELHDLVAWHDTLKRAVRVVMVSKSVGGVRRYALLFSTDTELSGAEIYRWYKARFQIEFLFRDAKQYTGLCDGQMRDEQALSFHFNLSLAALNLLRLTERARGAKVVSIASAKRRNYNKLLMNLIFSMLGLDPNAPEIRPHLDALWNYGALAA